MLLLPGLLLLLLADVGRAFRLPAPYYEHRQPVYAELVTTPPGAPPLPIAAVGINVRVDASPNPGLTTGIAGILQGQSGQRPEELQQVERLLDTAAMGMPLATGGEWVLMALAATRLTPAARASDAGQRFQSALARGLPARLELLEPLELVCLVNDWPRVGLDGLARHVIQAVVEACIQRLDAFAPAELAQLARGLCRPVTVRGGLNVDSPYVNVTCSFKFNPLPFIPTHPHPIQNTRLETLRALDAVAEETPDVNVRSRLFKAATKVLSRHVTELGPADLAAFSRACSTEMSLQDGTYARACVYVLQRILSVQ